MNKHSKEAVQYTPNASHHDERCGLCEHFYDPASCEVVAGTIARRGWCKLFEPKDGEQV